MEKSAASLFGIQPQLPSSSLHPFFKKCLFPSASYPSLYFLSLPSSPTSRGTSSIARAETSKGGENSDSEDLSSSAQPPSSTPPKKASRSGSGFGTAGDAKSKRKSKGRSAVVRRSPIERPSISPPPVKVSRSSEEQRSASEGAFLLAWLGLGLIILIEGIALAASGFLPEQWDDFLVKYLYPSFTPTCAVFISGTVVYGVLKYLQAEKMKS